MTFVTYNKKGIVTRHKTKTAAIKAATKRAKRLPAGEVAWVDKFTKKGLVNVERVISPKKIKKRSR